MTGAETTAVKKQVIIRKRNSGIALLILDAPGKANLMTAGALDEFESAIHEVGRDPSISAVGIVSGKPDSFVLGADLHEIIKFTEAAQALALSSRGQEILNALSNVPKPTVVGINGPCLGGGLELALACDVRIATDSETTQLGLPEVRLGFIPGLGGTQRLPRLIGARSAVELILSAEPVNAKRALELGLVDQVVAQDDLLEAVEAKALELAKAGKPAAPDKAADGMAPEKLKSFFAMSERAVRIKTKGKYPAQTRALSVIQKGLNEGLEAGLKEEAQAFAELSITDVSRNLVFLFFTTEFAKQSALSLYEKSAGNKITTIGIVGGGMMGTTIAQQAALSGLTVKLKTLNADRQQPVVEKVQEAVERAESVVPKGQVISAPDFDSLSDADIIVEACAEDEAIKADVLSKISDVAREDCVIATNTSSLSVANLANNVTDNKRFLGMHFFHPVDKMPLVELVAHRGTARDATGRASGLVCNLGKVPVGVKDTASFLVNRLVSCYLGQAGRLALIGTPLDWVEAAAVDFGMPMGPYAVADEIGLDVANQCGKTLETAFGARMTPPTLLKTMVDLGCVGKKVGKGVYLYNDSGKRLEWNPLMVSEGKCKLDANKPSPEELNEIAELLILPMIDEAGRCLEERVVRRAREIDMCLVLGIGFPPFRGGLLRYADTIGVAEIISKLENIYKKCGWNTEVSAYLKKLAAEGRGFYTRGSGED